MNEFIGMVKEGAKQVAGEVKKAGKVVVKKSGELADIAKLNYKISEAEELRKTTLEEIGKFVYEQHLDGVEFTDFIGDKCSELDAVSDRISELKNELSELKKEVTCSECGTKASSDASFCSKCGTKLN